MTAKRKETNFYWGVAQCQVTRKFKVIKKYKYEGDK